MLLQEKAGFLELLHNSLQQKAVCCCNSFKYVVVTFMPQEHQALVLRLQDNDRVYNETVHNWKTLLAAKDKAWHMIVACLLVFIALAGVTGSAGESR